MIFIHHSMEKINTLWTRSGQDTICSKVLKGTAYRRNPKHHVLFLDHVDYNEENIFPYEWEPENGSTVTARQVLQNIYWQNPIVQLYWLSHSNVLYEQTCRVRNSQLTGFDLFVLTRHLRVEDEVKITSWDAIVCCLWVYGLWTIWTIELRRVTLTMVMMTVLRTLLGDCEK